MLSNRKKQFIKSIILFFATTSVFAQEEIKTGWKNTATGNLNFSQSSFSNWKQGGESTWAWQLDINGKLAYIAKKFDWVTTSKLSYGRTKIGDLESKKSADEIRLESVLTYKAGAYVNPYFAVTGETQLTQGYDFAKTPKEKISQIFDPAYFTESIGLGYEPIKDLKTRFGLAFKQTVADEFAARYSDDPETQKIEKLRSEIGAESVTDFSKKLHENILFTTKLELFSTLKSAKEIDVRWDNVFTAKITKYIGVSFNFKLLYDRDISIKRQIKQVLGVGVIYSFL